VKQAGIVDNGKRMTFSTGAVREPHDGKGRFDLIPFEGVRRLALWYEKGAKKYADRNWEKGIPCSNSMNSLLRHAFKASAGWDDEDHLAAIVWNAFAIMFMQAEHPELDDLPKKHIVVEEESDEAGRILLL
jgi:hypothetical protein